MTRRAAAQPDPRADYYRRLRIALGNVALPEVAAAPVQPGAGGEGER